MTDNEKVNIDKIYISTPRLMGIPPNETKLQKEKAWKKKLRDEGKIELVVCCNNTRDFILGAIKLEITTKELNILATTLHQHPLDRFEGNKYMNKEGNGVDINSLVSEIFEISTFFKTQGVQSYFTNEFYKRVQIENAHSEWIITLEKFNRKWQEQISNQFKANTKEMQNFVDEIKNNIAKGNVELAIKLMKERDKDIENELIIHSLKYDDILKSERIGRLSSEEISREKTKIYWALLGLVDKIDLKISSQFNCKLSPDLEDALALAEVQSRREGKSITSTRHFFAALRKLKPNSLKDIILEIESRNGLPESVSGEVLQLPRSLSKNRTLSSCLTDSISNLSKVAPENYPIEVEDIFIDLAKYGTGASVKTLRDQGIDKRVIENFVDKYKIEIKRRGDVDGKR